MTPFDSTPLAPIGEQQETPPLPKKDQQKAHHGSVDYEVNSALEKPCSICTEAGLTPGITVTRAAGKLGDRDGDQH